MWAALAASGRTSAMAAALRASRLRGGASQKTLRRTLATSPRATTTTTPVFLSASGGTATHRQSQARRGLATDAAAPPAPPRTTPPPPLVLEVERKFAPTPLSARLLADNGGAAPFASLVPLGRAAFEDVYYDTPGGDLCRAGVWLRRRGGDRWEAKVRVGGDYTNSAFEELTDAARISALLGATVPGAALDAGGPRGGGLREVARFVSYRSKFLADRRFTVVIDATDFGHVVGEVELERRMGGSGTEGGSQEVDEAFDRAQVIKEMDKEIDDFMKSYLWAFPPGKPVGKLSAYFALKKHQ